MKKLENKAEYLPLSELVKLENNPRTIKKADFEKLKTSIKDNPDYFEARPIICSDRTGKNVILGGNQRYEAAKALGMSEVPVIVLHGLDEAREREIVIRDNVNNGDWDFDILANEWDAEQLQEWGLDEVKPFKEIEEDEPDPVDDENTYSIIGDIYQLGEHRIFCGSFDDDEKVRELFGDKKATCTFTDPPYNVAVKNRTTGKTIQNDNMDHADFQDLLNRAMECVAANMVPGGGVISWMSDVEILTLKNAMDNAGMKFKTVICWVKDHFTLGGGLHGKDLSKADVSVNIACSINAEMSEQEVEALCAIGDKEIVFRYADGTEKWMPYADVIELARDYINYLGGFEKLAEWGLF